MYLSLYITLTGTLSIANKAIPREVQKDTAFELGSVATLRMKWWQQLQGGLMVLTALCSLYLFSALGVENDPSSIVFVTGSLGIVSMGVAVLIGLLHY